MWLCWGRGGKGWGGSKSILDRIPRFFLIFKGEYRTYPFHTRREVRANLLNGKLEISPILTDGRRKEWGMGKSILRIITPLFLVYIKVHLHYLNPTRREVCVGLFNGKLPISSILAQRWRKDDMQISQFLVKSLNYFWDEYSSTWTKYWVWYWRPEATFYNRQWLYFSSLGVGKISPRVKWHWGNSYPVQDWQIK